MRCRFGRRENECSALCALRQDTQDKATGGVKRRPYEDKGTQAEACATYKASGQFAQRQRERDLSYKRVASLFLGRDEDGGVEQLHVWTRVGCGGDFLRRRRR